MWLEGIGWVLVLRGRGGTRCGGEVLLVIHSPLLAADFIREMDRLWKGAELGINPGLERKLCGGDWGSAGLGVGLWEIEIGGEGKGERRIKQRVAA